MYRQRKQNHLQFNMDIKRNKVFVVGLLSLFFSSCDSASVEMIRLFGLNIPERYIESYREERWIPFLGDGYKVVIFDITPRVSWDISGMLIKNNFIQIDCPISLQDYCGCQLTYTIHHGFIRSLDGTEMTMIWDSEKKRMIYIITCT